MQNKESRNYNSLSNTGRKMKRKKKEPEVWLDTYQVKFGWNSKVAIEYYKKKHEKQKGDAPE